MQIAANAWRWWTGELKALLPSWFGTAFLGAVVSKPLVFRNGISQLLEKGGRIVAPVEMFDATPPVLAALRRQPCVDVLLPKDRLLARQIEAPAKAASKITSLAALDLKRNTPFPDNSVLWGMGPSKKADGIVRATQWVAKTADVAHLKRQLTEAGLRVRSIGIEGEALILADYSANVSSGGRFWKWTNAGLVTGCLAVLGMLWLGPAWDARNHVSALHSDVAELRANTLSLRREVETLSADRETLDALQTEILQRPRLVETLRELTVSLPDQSWVASLSFQPTTVTFGGETQGAAVELILALSKSNFFEEPRQSGPTTRTGSGSERFEIAAKLRSTQ